MMSVSLLFGEEGKNCCGSVGNDYCEFNSHPHLKSYGFETLNQEDKLGSDPSFIMRKAEVQGMAVGVPTENGGTLCWSTLRYFVLDKLN